MSSSWCPRSSTSASVVDRQNAGDPLYRPLAGHAASSAAYRAALDLVFEGTTQPSGYTEPLLHAWRRKVKAAAAALPAQQAA